MNVNKIAKKALEWLAIGSVGFWIGVAYVANRALPEGVVVPEWYQNLIGMDLKISGLVVVVTILWIGLDYYELKIAEQR